MRYVMEGGLLKWGTWTLGLADLLYVDGREGSLARAAKAAGAVVCSLPVGDLLLVVGDGRVVGVESKRPADLVSSLSTRRLQRQLRQLREAVDVAVLGLRLERGELESYHLGWEPERVAEELFKWAALGGLVAFLPAGDQAALAHVGRLARVVEGRANPLSILAGTDRRRPDAATPFQRAMQRLFKGVGPALAGRLEREFGGDFMAALAGEWRGIPTGIRAQRDALLGRGS